MKKAIKDNALVSVNKGFMFNNSVAETPPEVLYEAASDALGILFKCGSLTDEYVIRGDYSLRWHKPSGESGFLYEIGIELLWGGVVVKEWDLYESNYGFYDLLYQHLNFSQKIAKEIVETMLVHDYKVNTPKTISISDFCEQLTDCADLRITPEHIRIIGDSLELILPDSSCVLFDAVEGYSWSTCSSIDYYNYSNFLYYVDSLDCITEYLRNNDFNLNEIDC